MPIPDDGAGFDAVHPGHPDVHQHDVGRGSRGQLDGGQPVAGLADDREVGFGLHDHPEPDTDHLPDRPPGARGSQRCAGFDPMHATGIEWKDRPHPPSAPWSRPGGEGATDRGDPFAHPDDPEAVR